MPSSEPHEGREPHEADVVDADADVDVVVVGAGLSGLTAATMVDAAGLSVRVLEARERLGGRLLSTPAGAGGATAVVDLGGTWHWDDQPEVAALAGELGVTEFPQHEDGDGLHELVPGDPPVRVAFPPLPVATSRFRGGAQQLCTGLAARLPRGAVATGVTVSALLCDDAAGGVVVRTAEPVPEEIRARWVVVALPPRLAHERLAFTPSLSEAVAWVMRDTPTWMGWALKVVVTYPAPFWRDEGLSGSALSEVGPLIEVHDACDAGGQLAALWAFGHRSLRALDGPSRRQAVLEHLARLFGPRAGEPLAYVEQDWAAERWTRDTLPDPEHPVPYGHARLGQPLWDGRLYLAGAETSLAGGGHMEGAVRAGQRAARLIVARAGRG